MTIHGRTAYRGSPPVGGASTGRYYVALPVPPSIDDDAARLAEPPPWCPHFSHERRARARKLAVALGRRLAELPVEPPAYGLASGYSGLALAFDELARCDPDGPWRGLAGRALRGAVEAIPAHAGPGMLDGLAGVAFCAARLAAGAARPLPLLERLDAMLVDAGPGLLAPLGGAEPLPGGSWDHIAGVTGLGAYLLGRREREQTRALLESVLDALAARAQAAPDLSGYRALPDARTERPARIDTGLSHGVAGPLALLALAAREGIEVAGQREAVAELGGWLVAKASADPAGPRWPPWVALADDGVSAEQPGLDPRPAWCYGSGGIAWALWNAGDCLQESGWRAAALDGLERALDLDPAERRLPSLTLCHGVAGTLQITMRLAQRTGSAELWARADALAGELLAAFDASSPYGIRDIDQNGATADRPGLLTGAAGVVLTLCTVGSSDASGWDRALLLS